MIWQLWLELIFAFFKCTRLLRNSCSTARVTSVGPTSLWRRRTYLDMSVCVALKTRCYGNALASLLLLLLGFLYGSLLLSRVLSGMQHSHNKLAFSLKKLPGRRSWHLQPSGIFAKAEDGFCAWSGSSTGMILLMSKNLDSAFRKEAALCLGKESKAWPSPWVYSDSCLRSTWVTFRFWVLQPLPSRVLFLVFKSLSAKVSRGTLAAQTSCNTRPILLCLGNFKRAEFSLKKSWALMEEKNHHFTQEDCSHSSINCLQTWNSGVPCCCMGQQCWMNWQMLRCCVISGSWAARTLLLSTHSFGSKPKELVCQKSAPHPSPDGINGALRCQDLPGAFTLPLVGANSLHSLQELAVGDGTYRLMMR